VQGRLFDSPMGAEALVDLSHDPYDELRVAAGRLVAEYTIDEEAAMQAIIGFGSESGARRILRQRWWNGEIEMREDPKAA
jgi:hypothetical protein